MEKSFKCDLNSEEFDSRDKLNAHIERKHERRVNESKKNFICNVCDYEFSKGSDLIKHMRTHTGERRFKCQVSACAREFKLESALKDHIKFKHSDERPLKCDFPGCLHASKTTWNLMKHKKVHTDDRPFACPHTGCNFRTKRKNDLSQHTTNVRSESKKFTCSECEYSTNHAGHLARHMIVHERKNVNIPCSVEGCEYRGKNSEALKEHMRRTLLLPCPVSGCGQYAATKKALKNHLKLHNPSGRAFQCPMCAKYYPRLYDLQNHCAVHTNEKPFQCGHCKHQAATRAQVKTHIFSVHTSIAFPLIVHLLDDRKSLRCKVTLPSAEFVVHCKSHVEPVLNT